MTRSPFFRAVLSGSLPLWLWAAQFAFSYGWVAVACHAGWDAPWVRGPLLAVGAAALVASVWLLLRACDSRRELLATVRRISALLAMVGIVWGLVPVFALPACRLG